MAKSVTRWENAAKDAIFPICRQVFDPYLIDGLLDPSPEFIYGPSGDIPEGQYECHRTWVTVELAQNWIDTVDSVTSPSGFTPTHKAVIE